MARPCLCHLQKLAEEVELPEAGQSLSYGNTSGPQTGLRVTVTQLEEKVIDSESATQGNIQLRGLILHQ